MLLRRTIIKKNTTTSRGDRLFDAATDALRAASVPLGGIAFGYALNVLLTGGGTLPGRTAAAIYAGLTVAMLLVGTIGYYVWPRPNVSAVYRSVAQDALVVAGVALGSAQQITEGSREMLIEFCQQLGIEVPAHLAEPEDSGRGEPGSPRQEVRE